MRRTLGFAVFSILYVFLSGTTAAVYSREFVLVTPEDRPLSIEQIEHVLETLVRRDELECWTPGMSPHDATRTCRLGRVWVTYYLGDQTIDFRAEDILPIFGSGRRTRRRVDTLVGEIRAAFDAAFAGIAYTEASSRGAGADQ